VYEPSILYLEGSDKLPFDDATGQLKEAGRRLLDFETANGPSQSETALAKNPPADGFEAGECWMPIGGESTIYNITGSIELSGVITCTHSIHRSLLYCNC